jgi:oligopeptide/dipeptide ABC transporter ATP-binding protein
MSEVLLRVRDLRVSFCTAGKDLEVVRGFSADLRKGETTGVLGESGSGKTVSFNSMLRLIDQDSGSIKSGEVLFGGRELLGMDERELRSIRGRRISYVFQNPAQAMNPYKSIGNQMDTILRIHGMGRDRSRVLDTMRDVGLDDPETVYDMYPFQLSGGQNQRAMIALGIILRPEILIADEPTSFVDASLRRKILDLFADINEKYGTSIVIITHDFDVARYACHRLIIMYGGLVMEEGGVQEILADPLHPYTEELIACTRSLNSNETELYSLIGTPISPHEFRNECPFCGRCRYKRPVCTQRIPDMVETGGRKVRCINLNRTRVRVP